MDDRTFDDVVRRWATALSRRGALRSVFASALTGLGAASWLGVEETEAKPCEKKCEKKKDCDDKKDKKDKKKCKAKCEKRCQDRQCTPTRAPGESCEDTCQCRPGTTQHVCGHSHGGGSVAFTCCGTTGLTGTTGAACANALTCCIPLVCNGGMCVLP